MDKRNRVTVDALSLKELKGGKKSSKKKQPTRTSAVARRFVPAIVDDSSEADSYNSDFSDDSEEERKCPECVVPRA